jgi:hypothetical protein
MLPLTMQRPLTCSRSGREHWLDPRLVESWTYEPDAAGMPRLVCTMGLPEGVRAELPPPAEKRIAIGGKFLDELQISLGGKHILELSGGSSPRGRR